MIKTERVYDKPLGDDGYRILVDRLWPRGLTKEAAKIDFWLKEIAPSDDLRKRFHHDPAKWDEFRKEYELELSKKLELLKKVKQAERENKAVTPVYAAKDVEHNNALALSIILQKLKNPRAS